MFGFPPLPPFEGMHPIIVHFPIAILMIAWLPMLLALADKKRRNHWILSAFLLLVLGTLFSFGAVLTGEATEDVVDKGSQLLEQAVHQHEETAEMARNIFIALTLLSAAVLFVRAKAPQAKKKTATTIGGVFVAALYIFGIMTLANASHQGGVLVHDLGIHAPVGTFDPASLESSSESHDDDDDDD